MKKSEFIEFLLLANKAGYADPDAQIVDHPDGGHESIYGRGDLALFDYWYGGNPFAGQEVVTVDEKAIWAMQYRGGMPKDFSGDETEVLAFIKKALSHCSEEEPLRGPAEFIDNDWRYTNVWSHDLAEFTGHEEILYRGEVVHITDYLGGLVDGAVFTS